MPIRKKKKKKSITLVDAYLDAIYLNLGLLLLLIGSLVSHIHYNSCGPMFDWVFLCGFSLGQSLPASGFITWRQDKKTNKNLEELFVSFFQLSCGFWIIHNAE